MYDFSPACNLRSTFMIFLSSFSRKNNGYWNIHFLIPETCEYEYVSLTWQRRGFPGGTGGKEPACQCRRCKRWGFNPWVWKIQGGRNGNAFQYSCLENSMDRGAWWATILEAAKSQMWLSTLFQFNFHGKGESKLPMELSFESANPEIERLYWILWVGPTTRVLINWRWR